MKARKYVLLGSFLISFFKVPSMIAAPMFWESATVVGGDAQILTSGVGVYAHTNSNVNQTINTVAFTGVNSSTNWGGGNVTLAFPPSTGMNTSTFGTPTGVSAEYGNLTRGAAYGGAGTATVTLNQLVPGRTYLAQIWVNDSRATGSGRSQTVSAAVGNSVVLDYNNTEAAGGAGQFSIGRFSADSPSQAFNLTSTISAQLNSLQLRDISNIGAWVGTGGTTWDPSTTGNFATNLFSDALNTATFDAAQASMNSVAFGDSYWDTGLANPVTQTAVTVAAGGVSTGRVYFDNHLLNYTFASADTTGITGSTAVVKTGTGTVTFNGANSYTGGTVVNGGTLALAAASTGGTYHISTGGTLALRPGSSFSQSAATTIHGTGTLRLEGNVVFGTAQTITTAMGPAGLILVTNNSVVTGSSTSRGRWDTNQASLQVDAGSTINFVEAGSTSSAFAIRVNALNGAGTISAGHNSAGNSRTLVVGVGGAAGTFSGTLADRVAGQLLALQKEGAGTQVLSGSTSTYTGVTTMAGGILNVASLTDYGVAGSLGARGSAQEAATNIGLRFMGGRLQYTGSTAQSTNRQIRIGISGGTIDASGSTPQATVSFTHSGTNIDLFDSPGARTLTLTGTNTGANTFAIALQDQSTNATSLTKTGVGTWVLTGNSSYTGTTNVSEGVLRIASVNALGGTAGNTSVPGGATNTSRLELTGGLVFAAEPLSLGGRQGGSIDAPQLSSLSGNNQWTGPITTTTGGATYNIESQAGLLTISGSISLSQSGTRLLQLMGAGNGVVSGVISGSGSNDARVTKKGAGTWTLSNVNTYTGVTNVTEGVLVLGASGSIDASSSLVVAAGAKLDTTAKANYALPANVTIGLDGNTAANGLIDATGQTLAINAAAVTFNVTGTLTASAYVLAKYSTLSGGAFASATPPAGYALVYNHNGGTQIALVKIGNDYNDWANTFTPPLGTSGEDDDGDGLTNFEEYAFGLDPTKSSSVNPVTLPFDRASGVFKYTRRFTPATTGVAYTYEYSTSLTGVWPDFTPVSVVSDNASPVEEIKVTVPAVLLTEPKLFLRVKAVRP